MASLKPHKILDQALFEKLFRAHFVYLTNFARQYVEDEDTAKDITQKVFINLWEKRSQIDAEKSIVSYLFTSVKNRCLNYIRDHKKYRSKVLDLDCGDIDLVYEEDDLAVQELEVKISKALEMLPEKCRMVFEMSRYQQKKYREIAEELDISQKTVEAHMSKAMKSLREHLKEYIAGLILMISWIW
jgi:RNA polymerase sigma-70 factor (ECF subfamily)